MGAACEEVLPLVSIIVPTHNRPVLLEETLTSLLGQTYPCFEILVISDGENEENRRVVKKLAHPHIHYFEQEPSGGAASPRNHGIRKAKGVYLAFCDDDDLWVPNKLESQVNILEANPKYALCYSKMLRFDDEKEWSVPHEEGPADFDSLLRFNTIPISSVVMRSSCIKKHGAFSEDRALGVAEDYEFLLRHAVSNHFYFCDDYLIKYRSGDERMTSSTRGIHYPLSYCLNMLTCYHILWRAGHITSFKCICLAMKSCVELARSLFFQLKLFLRVS